MFNIPHMVDRKHINKLVLSSMFLALALVMPFITGQIKQIGNALCPMHIPVILCGFFCGPLYALTVGFIAPLIRFILFGMPVIIPSGIGMSFELATYGFVSGLLYGLLPRTKGYVYVTLLSAMISGRAVWGIVRTIMYGLGDYSFGWAAFISSAFVKSIPGIIIQIILIPIIVFALDGSINKNTKEKV